MVADDNGGFSLCHERDKGKLLRGSVEPRSEPLFCETAVAAEAAEHSVKQHSETVQNVTLKNQQ